MPIAPLKESIFIRCTRLSNKLLTLSGVNRQMPEQTSGPAVYILHILQLAAWLDPQGNLGHLSQKVPPHA